MTEDEVWPDEPPTQIQVGGMFCGFKRPCRNCGEHFRTLNDDGWCSRCEESDG